MKTTSAAKSVQCLDFLRSTLCQCDAVPMITEQAAHAPELPFAPVAVQSTAET